MAHPQTSSASLLALLALSLSSAVGCSKSDDAQEERAEVPPVSTTCPVVTRGGGCRSAGWKGIMTIASGGLLLPAAGFPSADGGFLAFTIRWGDARLVSIRAPRPWAFGDAETLPIDASGATGVTTRGENVLYFVGQTPTKLALQVATVRDGVLGNPSPVELEDTNNLPSWPQAVALADSRVLLAFVAPQERVLVGVDDGTGKRFRMRTVPLVDPSLQGVLAHVGVTARGAWVLTYQVANAAWRFRAHVLVSHDEGLSWSNWNQPERSLLSASDDTLHAFPIARRDEGADIYYVKAAPERTVCRRALHEDGTLGIEQVVTSSSVGGVANPQPRRLPDGRIALMLSVAYTPTEKDAALVVLDGDAPP